jgi:2-amino-4-hydroxy-6-hydroxymethyldihydropteridine diphosphokinase
MSEMHRAYLSIGSNIDPEKNLPLGVALLKEKSSLTEVSTAWENHAVGAPGAPNFLNACVGLSTPLTSAELMEQVIRPVEKRLGRKRSADKNSARPIDIDIILFDGQPLRPEYWQHAFLIVPLAELLPDFIDPLAKKPLAESAHEAMTREWMLKRADLLLDP